MAPMADRYRAQARVGIGGTAVVYRCVDLHTERIVAVKVLRTNGPLIPEAAARFRREAHLAATLAHPHIVRMLDYGYTFPPITGQRVPWAEDPNRPVPYLAMEYVFGITLKELVRRNGPLPIPWVWRIGEQLCSALAAAHALGVVHRDVKPQNVMTLDAPLELLTKLTDFGIARQVGGDLTTLTATGQVIGTPDYLSPEQVLGEPGGPSSDLYSLGVVLYELLTAHLPFEADTPLAAASRRMVADPPPLTAYRRDIPAPLQEVILLALRRDAGDRFANVQEFAQALRWSREQSPPQPLTQRGAWALDRRPRPAQPAHPVQPSLPDPAVEAPAGSPSAAEASEHADGTMGSGLGTRRGVSANATPLEGEGLVDEMDDEIAVQSTVLRVITHLPELEGELRPEDRLPAATDLFAADGPFGLPEERLPDTEGAGAG
ncbi:MAG: protein kinase [Ktedonobacterales bacterium]